MNHDHDRVVSVPTQITPNQTKLEGVLPQVSLGARDTVSERPKIMQTLRNPRLLSEFTEHPASCHMDERREDGKGTRKGEREEGTDSPVPAFWDLPRKKEREEPEVTAGPSAHVFP